TKVALAARRAWLIGEGLASQDGVATHYVPGMLGQLQQRELARVAERLARQMTLPYREAIEGERIEGRLVRRLDLISGRFALLENSHEFTLVPWRSALERRVGHSVSGRLVGGEVDWRFGRGRAGPGLG
ncbi:hypothetical protein LTR94_034336, partial [Friedmanniomyces endolithicus]